MIIISDKPPTKPPLRKVPPPKRRGPVVEATGLSLQPSARPKVSPADTGFSLDERTQMVLDQIREEAEFLEDRETRDLWLDGCNTFEQTGDIASLIQLTAYRRRIVPIDEFMYGRTYLGLKRDEIYPGVIEACEAIDTDQFTEVILKGALGGGKTTIGNFMLARSLYKISCMRHPQSSFGIKSGSSLIFTIQSIRKSTAQKAVFEEFGGVINKSPYFKRTYPYDPLITSSMIFREQNVTIMPVATSTTGAISMNVIGGILDEVNFMQKILKSTSQHADDQGAFDQAKQIYQNIARRRKSRFAKHGKLPGILFLISSSRFPDDFTEKKAAEAAMCGGTDPTIYVYSKAVWESKGRDNFLPENFRVQVGNASLRSKILEEGEACDPECQELHVPLDFLDEFKDDLDGCIRDFAGVSTLSTNPFFTNRDRINECMKLGAEHGYQSPFDLETYDFSLGIPHPNVHRLRADIDAPRTVHIDLGLKRDACGITIAHLAGQKLVKRVDPVNGYEESHLLPVIGVDCSLRVVPPKGGEIQFAHIRSFILMMRDRYKIPIKWVTTDGFQSVDTRQILKTQGFLTDYRSVEDLESYRSLRDTIYEQRLLLPNNEFLKQELAGLEYKRTPTKDKIDHRANGTKDMADGLCGAVAFLLERKAAWIGLGPVPQRHPMQGHNNPPSDTEVARDNAHLAGTQAQGTVRRATMRKSVFRRRSVRK